MSVLAVALLAAGGTAAGAAALTSGDSGKAEVSAAPPPTTNPLAGRALHLDPTGHAPQQLREWESVGDDRALWLRRLAAVPTATWFAGGEPDLRGRVDSLVSEASVAGTLPVLVAYNVPGRDCGLYSQGGAGDGAAYLEWVRSLAAGIAGRPAIVVLEPDAIAQALDGCLAGRGEEPQDRYDLLAEAVGILTAASGTNVYLDAGNSGWVQDHDVLADALTRSGIEQAAGFAVNVSNFQTTQASTDYGRELSRRLGGARFVIDTSRNGSGPAADDGTGLSWCNPSGRTVGAAPTTDTGVDLVDAYLWIKVPGDSDGTCRPGEPSAGTWWPDYALNLVMQTTMGHPYTGH